VPIGELLDVIDASARVGNGDTPARDRVVVHHPLQPFDRRNFTAGVLRPHRRWSFDEVALGGAQALARGPGEPRPFLDGALPSTRVEAVELADLEGFVRHPVKSFLRRRLGVVLSDRDDELEDALPVDLDGLQQWHVGERLVEARLAGLDKATCAAAERARGMLPPAQLGEAMLNRIGRKVDAIVDAALAATPSSDVTSVEVNTRLPDGVPLVGTVPGVAGGTIRNVTYSRVAAKHRLVAWVRLLAATVAHPECDYTAVTVGRAPWGQGTATMKLTLAGDSQRRQRYALQQLGDLVDLYRRGLCEPLPLYCKTSFAYAWAVKRGRNPVDDARKEWESEYDHDREDREPEHRLVLGGVATLDEVLADKPRDDETGNGWPSDEVTRFGRYARHLWDPVLDREEAGRR
jgi:exodeoxyribonuclease V gamma subunit